MKNNHGTPGSFDLAERAPKQEVPLLLNVDAPIHTPRRWTVLMVMRRLHLYLGVFSAPAILFFAFTGILQTLSLHELSRDNSYEPQRWIAVLAQIHKKQTSQLSPPKAGRPNNPTTPRTERGSASVPQLVPRQHNPAPMKAFFVVIGAALIASTLSGMMMAWKFRRDRTLLFALFIAGIAVPMLLLVF